MELAYITDEDGLWPVDWELIRQNPNWYTYYGTWEVGGNTWQVYTRNT